MNTILKNVYKEIQELGCDAREVIQLAETSDDFELGNYRFIRKTEIDRIQQEELSSDEYVLGCFNADFIAEIIDIDKEVIEAMQSAEAFEALGKLIISLNKLEDLQAEYSALDGYGNHFSHYDGKELEIGDFYTFRTN